MTYGTLDGTLPPPPPPPEHKAQEWDGSSTLGNGHGTYTNSNPFTPPPVPSKGGGGKGTAVDTPSMKLFADNLDLLLQPLQKASDALTPVTVASGAFYHANQIRTKVTGTNGDDGIKAQYIKVLSDLTNGLTDLREGVKTLAAKYKTIDDANGMKSKDLTDAMDGVTDDFNSMMTDNGGTGAVNTPGLAPPPGGKTT
ncbi:hypothetical protein [Streptomyces fuscigenes]|uniref:hypothetical protein n=1 Tax=Streptomyces fuscigenes TaxID=1528880 RepID=UPI001F2628F9|nr:hypothetical protein [Streptomyces fuscigenes]MCF3964934.1 hypothetical protein [Streptomyces fuscigenes]